MKFRVAAADDVVAWSSLRAALWPEENPESLRREAAAFLAGETPATMLAVVFLAEGDDGTLVGMLELSLRPYADGCDISPVPYIEGWYVAPDFRRRGLGGSLAKAAEQWAIAHGYAEMASDALLENTLSEAAHKTLGFVEVDRAIRFRKTLRR